MSSVPQLSHVPPLVARDLSKSYGDRVVLDGVDLVVSPGVPLGLVGENGTGKSTLLRLLAGVEPSDAGDVQRPDDLAYLAQDPDFADADTIGDSPGGRTPALARSGRAPGAARGRPRRPSRRGRVREPARVGGPARRLGRRPSRGRSGGPARARRSRSQPARCRACPAVSAPGWPSPPSWRDAPPACCSTSPPTISTTVRSSSSSRSSSTCPGVVLVASHDRTFLENVCRQVVDLDPSHFGTDGRGGNRFSGGYSSYLQAKRDARSRWEQAFLAQQDELNELRATAKGSARQVAHNRGPRDNDKFIYHSKGENVARTVSRRVKDVERRIEVLEREQIPKPPKPLTFRGAVAPEVLQGRVTAGPRPRRPRTGVRAAARRRRRRAPSRHRR